MRRWREKSLSEPRHIPVMAAEVVNFLRPCPPGMFIDSTVGGGGHTEAVFNAFKKHFSYIGFDLDCGVIETTKDYFGKIGLKSELVRDNFVRIADYLRMNQVNEISAILYDLGLNSMQIDDPQRGFSYLADGPLGLSFEKGQDYAASKLLETISERELADILRLYGDEPRARSLAKAIKNHSPMISTTGQLAEIIRNAVGDRFFIKTSARVFQALRIMVNDEINMLQKSLASMLPMLMPGGRAIIISYHSLEDGCVKNEIKKLSGKCVCPPRTPECRCGKSNIVKVITGKPLSPSKEEIANNPRARSAKMRVVERIAA